MLHNGMNCLLLRVKHGVSGSLRLKVGTLHRELRTLVLELRAWNLHWGTVQEWGSNKLTWLQEAGPGIASRMLAQKTHLVFAILLYFLKLILDDDGLANQMLKIWVVGVKQLELDIILETLEKRVLLLLVGVDVISGVP
jgi:hypothetical protein